MDVALRAKLATDNGARFACGAVRVALWWRFAHRETDWTLRLPCWLREFEQAIMALYRAEYMVGGTDGSIEK